MKKFFLISTLIAAAAGTTFADENNVPANNENRVPAAEIAVPENNAPANAEAAAGTQNADDSSLPADSAETDEAALEIAARESADDAGTDEIDDSQTAKLLDEALENLDKNAATSGNVAADSAEISDSAGTDFTIFGHTFHVDPTKTHAPLVEPASSAPAGDKRVRLVLPAVSTKVATQTPAKTDDDDDGNSVAGTVAGTAILSTAGTQNLTLAGTNTGIATRSFFSTASTSSTSSNALTRTAVYSTSAVTVVNATTISSTGRNPLIPNPVLQVDTDRDATEADLTALFSITDSSAARGTYAVVKDGAGTLTISNLAAPSDTSSDDVIKQTLVVREGTLSFVNSSAVIASVDAKYVGITVGGNENATLILENSSLTLSNENGKYGVTSPTQLGAVVGSLDGDGSVTLQENSTWKIQHCLFIGATNGPGIENNPGTCVSESDSSYYAPIYANLQATPTGTVSVLSGSTLDVGQDIYLYKGSVSVSGTDSTVNVHEYDSTYGGYIYVYNSATFSASDGSTVNTERGIRTYGNAKFSATGAGTTVSSTKNIQLYGNSEITVSDNAKMSTSAYTFVGVSSTDSPTLKVESGGTFESYETYVGFDSSAGTLEVANEGTFIGYVYACESGEIHNAGTITGDVDVNGLLENAGTITGTVAIYNDKDGTGTLKVTTENVSATTVAFETGSILFLANDLVADVNLPTDESKSTTLNIISSNEIYFGDIYDEDLAAITSGDVTGTVSPYAQYDSAFKDYEKSWNYTGSVLQLTLTYIPEPSFFGLLAGTFALALAGTRRRRNGKL